jgi:hypothetical protein
MKVKLLILTVLLCLAAGLIADTLPALPLQNYDYHVMENILSPITLGMGGLNLTNAADYFTGYDNPALLAGNTGTAFATSFRLTDEEELTFADAVSASNLLKSKQFMYYTLIANNSAWSYHPTASTHVSQLSATTSEYYDYQLDKIQLSLAGTDEKYTRLSGGINLKYMTGRLVYLKEQVHYGDMIREQFIDNKIKGVSLDLGFTWSEERVTWGACFYDLLSRMWWESYDSESLQRRGAMGFEYRGDTYSLLGGLQGKIASSPATTYHLGMIKHWNWKSGDRNSKDQSFVLRAGMFSKDFNGTENINYTLGSGYNLNMFRIDFALTNGGMRLKDSQYLFSVGVGIK